MGGSCLSVVVLLLCSGKGEVDLSESWIEDFARELLQVVVEGMGVEQFEDGSRQEREGGAKQESKDIR